MYDADRDGADLSDRSFCKSNVEDAIRSIEIGRRGSPYLQDKVKALAATFGQGILKQLPPDVCKFTYSETLPEIIATRDTGTESWDAKQALAWALDYKEGSDDRSSRNAIAGIL